MLMNKVQEHEIKSNTPKRLTIAISDFLLGFFLPYYVFLWAKPVHKKVMIVRNMFEETLVSSTVDPRYLDFGYLE